MFLSMSYDYMFCRINFYNNKKKIDISEVVENFLNSQKIKENKL